MLQLFGYPLAPTQADLTARQRAFLLLAMPEAMRRFNGLGASPGSQAQSLKQKIAERRKAQRALRRK